MYVKKFQSETLDGALKEIKKELGPDAIILKTITNKGIKGVFNKKKIEITAAISEKNYLKKAKVDAVLPEEQKNLFYTDQAGHISQMIDQYEEPKKGEVAKDMAKGYGKFGINKAVNITKNSAKNSGLDNFLNVATEEGEKTATLPPRTDPSDDRLLALEKRVSELSERIDHLKKDQARGIIELKTTLRGVDISEKYIKEITRKAMVELSPQDITEEETIYEFTLREMLSTIKVGMPLFSRMDTAHTPVVTLLLSRSSCGQSGTTKKLAALNKGSIIVEKEGEKKHSLAQKIYNIESFNASSFSEIVTKTREATEKNKSVFIDYKDNNKEINDAKKVVDGLRRSFDHVEVLGCISSIHTEAYNRKILSEYSSFLDGIIVTYLDLCLNYGALFNIAHCFQQSPIKFFGTGDIIPDDIESATGERIMAGLFQLD